MIRIKAESIKTIKASEMKIGDTGVITEHISHDYVGHVVLRSFDGLVSLADPKRTWSDIKGLTFRVQLKNYELKEIQ